ncbi:MAG: hypothetical protein Q4G29_01540 [Pseudoscardovia radai]|nr:hypothetical protein [Pseudoscardovia radai]
MSKTYPNDGADAPRDGDDRAWRRQRPDDAEDAGQESRDAQGMESSGPFHGIVFDDSVVGVMAVPQDSGGAAPGDDEPASDVADASVEPAPDDAAEASASDGVADAAQYDAPAEDATVDAASSGDAPAYDADVAETQVLPASDSGDGQDASDAADPEGAAFPDNPENPEDSENSEDSEDSQTPENPEKAKPASKPHRRTRIMRGVITPIFAVLALIALVFGILNSTVWKPQHDVAATASSVSTRYLATVPGALQLVDDTVTVKVSADNAGTQLCADVTDKATATAWLDGTAYTQVDGMKSWTELSTERTTAGTSGSDGAAAASLSFEDADTWIGATCGTGSVTLGANTYSPQAVLIVAADAQSADGTQTASSPYTVQLEWHRASVPNYAMPFYVVALLFALLAVLAASVFAHESKKHREAGEEETPLWEQTAVMMRLRHREQNTHREDAASDDGTPREAPTLVESQEGVEIKDEVGTTTASYSVSDFREYFNQLQSENPGLSASAVLEDVATTTGSMEPIKDAPDTSGETGAPGAADASDASAASGDDSLFRPHAGDVAAAAADSATEPDSAAESDGATDESSDGEEGDLR